MSAILHKDKVYGAGGGGGGGGATTLADLTDVAVSSPTDGQVLTYDDANDKWVNANASGGASAMSDLTDVDLSNLEDGQIIKWDDENQKWVNANESGGGGNSGLNVIVTKILDQHIATTGNHSLNDSIDNYDAILVCGYNYVTSSNANQYKTALILKEDYYKNTSNHADHLLGNMTGSTVGDNPRRVIFYFPDSTHINIQTRNYASIDKIFGIKFLNTNVYSTQEQVIGTWIDGRPIYQITVELSTAITINANGWTNTTISKTNIDNIVSVTAGKKGNNFWGQVMGAINSSVAYLQIGNARNTSISVDFYTFQYTKTTD